MAKYVSTRPDGYRDYCGIGNVIIPRDQDPVKYIASCYTKGTVSIVLENGGIIDNVVISKSVLRDIQFPDKNDYTALGAQVVWLNLPRRNQPIVVGVYNKNNEFVDLTQTGDLFGKSSKNGTAKIFADSDKGVIIVTCSSSTENNGDIYIIATNKNKNSDNGAKLNLQISGSVNINTPNFNINNTKGFNLTIQDKSVDNNATQIIYQKGKGLTIKDEFGNVIAVNDQNIQLMPQRVLNIGNGKSPVPLGDLLTTQLSLEQQRLTAVITALVGLGVTITLPAGDYTNVLSKVTKTD